MGAQALLLWVDFISPGLLRSCGGTPPFDFKNVHPASHNVCAFTFTPGACKVLSLTSFQDIVFAVIHCCRRSFESFSCCFNKILDRNSLREERFCSSPAFLGMDAQGTVFILLGQEAEKGMLVPS